MFSEPSSLTCERECTDRTVYGLDPYYPLIVLLLEFPVTLEETKIAGSEGSGTELSRPETGYNHPELTKVLS